MIFSIPIFGDKVWLRQQEVTETLSSARNPHNNLQRNPPPFRIHMGCIVTPAAQSYKRQQHVHQQVSRARQRTSDDFDHLALTWEQHEERPPARGVPRGAPRAVDVGGHVLRAVELRAVRERE
eukprot:6194253-Pleurochrysis_carterae.AAC.1